MMQGFYLMTMQRMRRQRRIALAACALAAAFVLLAVRAHFTAAPAIAEVTESPYTATIEGNRIIVTRDGETVIRTAIDTRTLPSADRAALQEGIQLDSAEALAKLLEDYSG